MVFVSVVGVMIDIVLCEFMCMVDGWVVVLVGCWVGDVLLWYGVGVYVDVVSVVFDVVVSVINCLVWYCVDCCVVV